jgi:hypothetical protein
MKNHDSNLNVSSPLKPSPIPGHLVLKQIPNRELIAKLKLLVSEERKILTEILLHLQEVERRDLHLDEGYSPLFDYAVKNLGYTGSQAYRRIAAMRLMTEIPELKASLDSGELNLTQLTQARGSKS